MTTSLESARAAVARPAGMTAEETRGVIGLLMSGAVQPAEGAALLEAWSARGETGEELVAVVRLLLERAVAPTRRTRCLEVVGTGGSGLTRFNVSTTACFLLAAAGVPVAKHGNKGSQRPNGSFDLLETLGIPFAFEPAQLDALLADTGVCFLFARRMHPTMATVAPMRRICPRRTIFNLAGPLANPWRPSRQLVGCARSKTSEMVARACAGLGLERCAVVFGHPGIDEVSITGPSEIWEVEGNEVRHRIDHRFARADLDHASLPGGDAGDNALVFHRLLAGEERGAIRDMVVVNAGMALDLWRDRPLGSPEGVAEADALLASGAALACFERHRAAARRLAGLPLP